jgi:dipeptidyl aminopeptidase/acylaminoacyl peptidase
MRLILVLLISIVSCLSLPAQKRFELSDLSKLTSLNDPQISPDGKSIVLVVSRPDYKLNASQSELILIDIASGKQKMLTQNRSFVSQPRWSPDGTQLAFVAKTGTGKEAINQIFILSSFGEAKQLTKTPTNVQHFSWKTDGEAIAFVSADEATNKEEVKRGNDAFEVGNNDMFLIASPTPSHIWLINTEGGEPKKLTSGSWSLPVTIPPGAPSSPLSWSPNGKMIAFVKVIGPHSGDGPNRSVQLLNVETGAITPLTGRSKFEGYPSFSADGNSINYWYVRDGIPGNINDIYVAPVTGGEGRSITTSLDREMSRAFWMPDGKNLLVGGHDDNRVSLWLQPLNGAAKKLNLGTLSPSWSFWIDASVDKNGAIAFTASDPKQPTELYYMSSTSAQPRRLTHFNKDVSSMSLGKSETMRWDLEGFKHNGILTYPVNYVAGNKYPLVLIIHGGPAAASVETFSSRTQLLANKGYFVFEPNYRGSDNMGSAYKKAIIKDAGAGPGRDVMAGLAKLKNTGMIDTTRIGITGWSYGGFMTVWLAGHYPGWKAAIAGAAVTDWVDQYNLGDANVNRGNAIGGSPWVGDNMKLYIAQSPISMAHKITAPTLILANIGDPRVPVTQSYKLYHVLKDNGVPTKFIAWNIPAHNASDPVRQMEVSRLWLDWMDQYLGSK